MSVPLIDRLGALPTATTLSIVLLGEVHGVPDGDPVHCVYDLTIGELRSLCAVVVRLETYLDWAEKEQAAKGPLVYSSYRRGFVEAHKDVRKLILEGYLEEMLRDVGEEDLAKELEELLGVTP